MDPTKPDPTGPVETVEPPNGSPPGELDLDPDDEHPDDEHPDDEHPDDEHPDDEHADDEHPDDEHPDTFPRDYVERLRGQSRRYRQRAQEAEAALAATRAALWEARVRALDLLADPTDLPYDEAILDNPDAITQAARDLITRKPHLAARRARGNIGQHANGADTRTVSLADILRAHA